MQAGGEFVGERRVDDARAGDAGLMGECRSNQKHGEMRLTPRLCAGVAGVPRAFVVDLQQCRGKRGGKRG